ncbi:hypothetical protein [Abyssalbus ytuae]|uniref:Uncharacterized protein n=1 Tax=Abyssalbus ytuae TaxID=2926907 RepID=A0A9E7A281_9FLAO|nr:hypothetical protein [Abyssalbus ytuae]UOB18426.1 hypothetical protein MQE35_03840 [Abyssalbus ytuae]
MKKTLLILNLFAIINCFGQYLDFPGEVFRKQERDRAKEAYDQYKKTALEYSEALPVNLSIRNSKTRLSFNFNNARIDYLDYKGMCNSYLNPFKKKACQNRYNYLKEAHYQVLQLMNIYTNSKINVGVKELIGEKYTSITNTIIQELETMKQEAQKNILYHLLPKNK